MTLLNPVAVDEDGLPPDQILGDYFFYSLPEDMLSLRTVRKAFRDAGLDDSRLPTERRPEHVAQEAVRKIERVVQNGHREEIRTEQVDRTSDFWIGQVTRHVQDKANRVVEHPKALRVLFDLGTSDLSFQPLDGATMADVQSLVDEIQAHFDANQTKIPGHKLRTILRHYVEAAGSENMRGNSGGIYWLARHNRLGEGSKLRAHHGDAIDGLAFLTAVQAMLTQIYGASVANFHRIPCVNAEGQREFLKRRFMENISEDAKEFRDEVMELMRSKGDRKRGFRTDLRARLVERRHALDERRAKFSDVLGETLGELDRDMQLAESALRKFLTEADA